MKFKDLLSAPLMIGTIIVQLFYYTFTEVEMFLLAVMSVLFGFLLGPLWGATIYVSVYLAWRMTGSYMTMIASKLHLIASVMDRRQENK